MIVNIARNNTIQTPGKELDPGVIDIPNHGQLPLARNIRVIYDKLQRTCIDSGT
jgi:hypothetical protein